MSNADGSRATTRRRSSRWHPFAVLLAIALLGPAAPATALDPLPEPVIEGLPADWPAAPDVDAVAYLLVEGATGQILAAHREGERRPVASTIKTLTALTAAARATADDEVTVGDEVVDVGGASVGLEPGDVWTVDELLTAIIARSGNEAAHALAVHVAGSIDDFLELMADDLAALGVSGVTLTDVSGLDDGNLLSATDLATIGRAALADPDLRAILGEPIVVLPDVGAIESRNELLRSYPDATGVKTGFTQAAGYSLIGSAQRGDRELVAVVLGSGDDPARFEAVAALLDHGFASFRPSHLSASLEFAVAGGGVVLDVAPFEITVPAAAEVALRLPVQARPPDEASSVPIEVDGASVASAAATLERTGSAGHASGAAAIGAAAVDGAYAALRAGAATGSLR